MIRSITVSGFKARMDKEDVQILDVREADEFAIRNIRGAINLPLSGFPEIMNRLDKNLKYYVIDASGDRSHKACHFLTDAGYYAIKIKGGMEAWPENI